MIFDFIAKAELMKNLGKLKENFTSYSLQAWLWLRDAKFHLQLYNQID